MAAVWESDLLPLEKLIAAVYADHARDRDSAWVALPRLVERSGLSRRAAGNARGRLVEKHWLVEIDKARQHSAATYRLNVPDVHETPPSSDPSMAPDAPLDGPGWHQTSSRGAPRATNYRSDSRTAAAGDDMKPDLYSEQMARLADVLAIENPVPVYDAWVRHRPELRNPIAVLKRMPTSEVRSQFSRYKPKAAAAPKCADCDGRGLAEDDYGHITSAPCRACDGSGRATGGTQ